MNLWATFRYKNPATKKLELIGVSGSGEPNERKPDCILYVGYSPLLLRNFNVESLLFKLNIIVSSKINGEITTKVIT